MVMDLINTALSAERSSGTPAGCRHKGLLLSNVLIVALYSISLHAQTPNLGKDIAPGVLLSKLPEHVRPSSLLKRFATVDEVAAMVAYLAGELSSATNGAALRVDGG